MSTHVRIGEGKLGVLKKRKDRDSSDSPRAQSVAGADPDRSVGPDPARTNNRLLAGCLAHEFLTKGTLFGKQWEETSGSEPDNNNAADPVRPGSGASADLARAKPPSSYAEVSYLLKADGARIPSVVNPTQLAQWLQM